MSNGNKRTQDTSTQASPGSIETTDLDSFIQHYGAVVSYGPGKKPHVSISLPNLETAIEAKIRDSLNGLLEKKVFVTYKTDDGHGIAVPVEAIQSVLEELQGGKS